MEHEGEGAISDKKAKKDTQRAILKADLQRALADAVRLKDAREWLLHQAEAYRIERSRRLEEATKIGAALGASIYNGTLPS